MIWKDQFILCLYLVNNYGIFSVLSVMNKKTVFSHKRQESMLDKESPPGHAASVSNFIFFFQMYFFLLPPRPLFSSSQRCKESRRIVLCCVGFVPCLQRSRATESTILCLLSKCRFARGQVIVFLSVLVLFLAMERNKTPLFPELHMDHIFHVTVFETVSEREKDL